jgi:hypothetical protein
MTMTMLTRAVACLLLCATTTASRADPAQIIASATGAEVISAMIDCGMWVSAIPECPRLDGAGALATVEDSTAPHLPGEPDSDGIKRDTYYFLGLQLSIVGALYFMPESVSGWSDQQKEQHRADKWWNNVSDPTWDDDEHYINYVLHPYWGAAYYVRARERGYGSQGAFWYSVLLSTLYETGVEALFEPVSIQDFFVTPVIGSWLGGHFVDWRRSTRDRIATSGERRFRDKALLVLTDPLGNAAAFVDRRLGRDVELGVRPFVMRSTRFRPRDAFAPPRYEEAYGLTLTMRW